MKQKKNYGEGRMGVALDSPDFVMIAKAFDTKGVKVDVKEEIKDTLKNVFRDDRTTIIDVNADPR